MDTMKITGTIPKVTSLEMEIMKSAAENFHRHTESREKKAELLKQKLFTEVESKERLAKRANHLLDQVRWKLTDAKADIPAKVKAVIQNEPIKENEMSDLLFERVLGATKDFLSIEFLEKGAYINKAICRIVTKVGNGYVAYGTGFLVSPHLLITNWHVLETREAAAKSTLEFNYQLNVSGSPLPVQKFELEPGKFFMTNKELDFTLVAVKEFSATGTPLTDMGYCKLVAAHGKISVGELVNIIQHPRGEMKQVVMRENKLLDLPDPPGNVAHYEGDTDQGSSGSPVFNDDWEVVALHHTSVPKIDDNGSILDIDGNIWHDGDDPARIHWVANEGIRISSLIDYIGKTEVLAHEKVFKDELMKLSLAGFSPREIPASVRRTELGTPLGEEKSVESVPNAQQSALKEEDIQKGKMELKVPLMLNISLSTQNLSPIAAEVFAVPSGTLAEEKITPDKDYTDRPGFNPEFLGIHLPLPRLTNSILPLAAEIEGGDNDNRYELKYYHYSVIMNAKRRLAFVSAVNFNGAAKYKHTRDSGGDKWFIDPRVKDFQAGDELYSDNPLDRGHLTRRADAAWGLSQKEAKLANDDTFHFTNCTPQHEIFNQATKADNKGLLLWGNIEEYIAQKAKEGKMKLSIFNGPVFRQDDRCYRGTLLPREFWKIIVYIKDDGMPSALAFKLSQKSLIKGLAEETFEPGPYAPYQVKVREIEELTKLDFGELSSYDPLNSRDMYESYFESGSEAVPLWRLNHIIL